METITVQQIEAGESLQPVFQIFSDSEGTTPYNLSTLDNVVVWFCDNRSNSVLKKYSMNPLTDHDSADFVIIEGVSGLFSIRIESGVTVLWKEGVVRFEISIKDTVSGFTDFKKISKENIYSVKNNLIKII